MKNFPGPFRSPWMFKYKEKMAFTYNIQSVVHCRKFINIPHCIQVSNSQHKLGAIVFTIAACFPFEPLEKCMTFKDIFPWLSTTEVNVQEREFSRKKSWTFQEVCEPCMHSPSHSFTVRCKRYKQKWIIATSKNELKSELKLKTKTCKIQQWMLLWPNRRKKSTKKLAN